MQTSLFDVPRCHDNPNVHEHQTVTHPSGWTQRKLTARSGVCADCPNEVVIVGSGRVPKRCSECQGKRNRLLVNERRARRRAGWVSEGRCYQCGDTKFSELALCQLCHKKERERYAKLDASVRWARQLAKYNLTPEQYDELVNSQSGCCAICGQPPPEGRPGPNQGRLHIDHDHSCCPGLRSCGKCVRGLLCHRCNGGAGLFDDSPQRLRAAAEYFEGWTNVRSESQARAAHI